MIVLKELVHRYYYYENIFCYIPLVLSVVCRFDECVPQISTSLALHLSWMDFSWCPSHLVVQQLSVSLDIVPMEPV